MQTTSLVEIELEVKERLKKAEEMARQVHEPKHRKNPAAEERQRILGILAGTRSQFIREMENIEKISENADVLLILNAKIVAIEQAIKEIENNR